MPSSEDIVGFLRSQNAVKEGESPWPTVSPEERRNRVNYNEIFPTRNPERDTPGSDTPGDEWQPTFPDWITSEVENSIGRGQQSTDEPYGSPNWPGLGEWDLCAWYQPMHFFGEKWGIFIRKEFVFKTMIRIASFLPPDTGSDYRLFKALYRASFAIYFLHEQFHHKMESLGIRLHVVERRSVYLPYKNMVYRKTLGTDENLEEALANADSFIRLRTNPYRGLIGRKVLLATKQYLFLRFKYASPGYCMAVNYLENYDFQRGVHHLQAQFHEATVIPVRDTEEWAFATRLMQSLFKVSDNLWEII